VLVIGKSPDDVARTVGVPDEAAPTTWTYHGKTVDPATGKPDPTALITFANGAAVSVTFK